MSTKGFGGDIDSQGHGEDASSPLLLVVTQESPLLLHLDPDSQLLNESAHMRVSRAEVELKGGIEGRSGPRRARTVDPRIKSPLLYRLSYRPHRLQRAANEANLTLFP